MYIVSSKFVTSCPHYDLCPPANRPEYAFIGRSNVGKSSLINSICQQKELAKTSPAPWKTQLINYFSIDSVDEIDSNKKQSRYLVDLPGYGFAKVGKDTRIDREVMTAEYLKNRINLLEIFVLIDSRHSPQKIDIAFINQLWERKLPFTIVFTKSDLVKQKELQKNLKAFMQELGKTRAELPWFFVTSALNKQSTKDLIRAIHELNETPVMFEKDEKNTEQKPISR